MSTDQPQTDIIDRAASATAKPNGRPRFGIGAVIVAALAIVIVLDVLAFVAFFPAHDPLHPEQACAFPACFINGMLEFPAPHTVIDLGGGHAPHAEGLTITFYPAITSTVFTLWIVSGVLLLAILFMSRGGAGIPGRLQNIAEWAYESLSNFGTSIAGPAARPYIPIFAAFFLLILFSNWIGLVPPVGRVQFLRAPTSDVNVTIGLALVAFAFFEFEGFRRLGARRYLGKFFPITEFRNGFAAGAIAMFVGVVELLLDFVRPLTLSMRLFGNIYGGEVALGVITALTVAILPVALLGLEFMLNLIQALIFSILALMYIVLAIESHDHEEEHVTEEAVAAGATHASVAAAH